MVGEITLLSSLQSKNKTFEVKTIKYLIISPLDDEQRRVNFMS